MQVKILPNPASMWIVHGAERWLVLQLGIVRPSDYLAFLQMTIHSEGNRNTCNIRYYQVI